jgi:preprotein translocase subunit SecD
MNKDLRWRLGVSAGAFLFAIVLVLPTFLNRDFALWGLGIGKLNLGLDLKGGMHIVYGVKTMKAVHEEMGHRAEVLKETFTKEGYPFAQSRVTDENTLVLTFADGDQRAKARAWLDANWASMDAGDEGPDTITLRIKPDELREIEKIALDQAREKIVRRIDQFGVREPSITTQGKDQIVVRLPGVVDPEEAKKLLGRTAVLHFKIVPLKGFAPTKEQLLAGFGGQVPDGMAVYPSRGKAGDERGFYALPVVPSMTGANLTDARPSKDEHGFNSVSFQFDAQGAEAFGALTAANIDKPMAIVLDDIVMSAPVIRSKITSRGEITGNFTREETRDLSIVLRSGSLPVPVEIEEERTVGPLLGKDSIRKGSISLIMGTAAVFLFMAIYYRKAGLIADLALVLNAFLILAAMSLFDATLSFPGIAGIVLTIGMAVDANVLIDERIREELRAGRTPRVAIDAGYKRAFSAILDSNVTTVGAAAILFQFGTGPIKGFAVTLTLGIAASMFTAVFVTHAVFDLWTSRRELTRLSI